jgi:cobalt/nickel transport system ATP-binding protein
MGGARVEIERLRVFRGVAEARRVALDGATLQFEAGERVFLMGPNGAGKTSLLLALVGAAAFEGQVRIGGSAVTPSALPDIRRRVGYVFADPSDQFLLDEVHAEVAFGPRERGLDEAIVGARVHRALAAVRLTDHAGRHPGELSLGEQRRLALATVLATEPEVVLLDEPTAALDPRARRAVLEVIAALPATVVVATHDLDAATFLGGRAVLVDGGKVVAQGDARELLADPELLARAGLS